MKPVEPAPILPPIRGEMRRALLAVGMVSHSAYLYPGGVLVKVEHVVHMKGASRNPTVEAWHAFPAPKNRRLTHSNHDEFHDHGRIVVHEPRTLLDGLQRVEVFRDNYSTKMKELGVTCDTVVVITASEAVHRHHLYEWSSGAFTIQASSDETFDNVVRRLSANGATLVSHATED